MTKYKIGDRVELSPKTKAATAIQGVVIYVFTAALHSQMYQETDEQYEARREAKTTYLLQLDPLLIKSEAI